MTSNSRTPSAVRRCSIASCLLLGSLAACQGEEEPGPLDLADARVVAEPATLRGPNGMGVDADGMLYVAAVLSNEITVHEPEEGRIVERLGPAQGVRGPDDVLVAPDGTLYWTETVAGNVGMRAPDGTVRTQHVGLGANPIALSDDGRLFVARVFFGGGLYELDPRLLDPPTPILSGLVGLNGMEFGPDGLLYGPLFFEGSVVRIDVDAAMPEPEVVATGFRVPSGVAFSPAGELHVVDYAEGQVLRIDPETGDTEEVLLDIQGTLDNIVFGPDGTLYASAVADGRVIAEGPTGQVRAIGEAGLIMPGGVAVLGELVWVADYFSLRAFGRDRDPERTFYDRFDPPGLSIASTNTVAVMDSELVISGWFSNSIQVIDPTTGAVLEDIRSVPVPVNAIGHGEQLVAASLEAAVVVDARTGAVLLGGLTVPLGLASDGETLYVGDWATGTIWRLDEDGDVEALATGLQGPEGLALDGERLLVVEEGNDRVLSIDLESGARRTIIRGLELGAPVIPGTAPFGVFNGIAVGPDGEIVVTSDVTSTAYSLR